MRDLFGTRLELRLGDPIDSEIDRRIAALVPTGRPGRGLVPGKLHFLGRAAAHRRRRRRRHARRRRRATWSSGSAPAGTGPTGPKLRLLPERIDLDDGARAGAPRRTAERRLLLGIDEKELAPVGLDVDGEPHLLIFGDGQSGKSAVLRSLRRARSCAPARPQQAQIVARRLPPLAARRGARRVPARTTSPRRPRRSPAIAATSPTYLQNRIPGPDVTPEQLRNRSWWTGRRGVRGRRRLRPGRDPAGLAGRGRCSR